jgi:hypothetical protein
MARLATFALNFFSAAFVILLVLSFLALGNPVVADEPLNTTSDACYDPDEGCANGDSYCTDSGTPCCCRCEFEGEGGTENSCGCFEKGGCPPSYTPCPFLS